MDGGALAELLNQSLDFRKARESEAQLRSLETQAGFAPALLQLVATADLPTATRQAGAVYFKNLVLRKWTDEAGNWLLPTQDVEFIRNEIVGLMIALPVPLQAQIGEAVALIADSDFPHRWPTLVPSLVARLGKDVLTNNGVLAVAHAIFRRWRPLFRSDELFREILLVLSQFQEPYLHLMVDTDRQIKATGGSDPQLLQTMNLLVKLYYDLNVQDVPEFFEDHLSEFMGILHSYLSFTPSSGTTDDDDEAGVIEEIRSGVCDVLVLYAQKFEEGLDASYIESVWALLMTLGLEPKYDMLVSRGLAFLTAMAATPQFSGMFATDAVLEQVVQKIVIPNLSMRPSDEELFEDDPIEYVRRDVEGSDADASRRHAATAFLRELSSRNEAETTKVVMGYVTNYMAEYHAMPSVNWRAKNTATHLFAAIAAKGNVTSAGVSTTNLLVDVVGYFNTSIAPEISNSVSSQHPILRVDAVKFINIFRNQLTKDQLRQALPLLVTLLSDKSPVVYTWAAVAIERILALRDCTVSTEGPSAPMFTEQDIRGPLTQLVGQLLKLVVANADSPERLAANEFVMRCLMRVLAVAQGSVAQVASTLLPDLVGIMTAVSSNPANPRFTHYLFESIAVLIKLGGLNLATLDEVVVQPSLQVLASDVTEFVPYILQILTLILRLQPVELGLPTSFAQLARPLLSPVLWEARGNAPALVMLLQAILSRGPSLVASQGLLQPLLGVFQSLVASSANDHLGLELMEHVLVYIPLEHLSPYLVQVAQLLLVRLQNSRTSKFVSSFARFVYFLSAIESQPALGPKFAIDFLDAVQEGIFGQVFQTFVLPYTLKINGMADRRIAAVGLSRLLCEAPQFLGGAYMSQWPEAAHVLVGLLKTDIAEKPAEDFVVEVDLNELSFGSTFSRLQVCQFPPFDPVPSVTSPRQFVESEIKRAASENPSRIAALVGTADADTRLFLEHLTH